MTQYTNNTGIPLALCVLFVNDLYDHSSEPNIISVTTLLDSVRQIILGMRATGEGTKDVSDMVASCYGTALHSALEQAWLNPYKALEELGYPKAIVEKGLNTASKGLYGVAKGALESHNVDNIRDENIFV